MRQGADKAHNTVLGLDLVGPAYLLNEKFESDEIAVVKELMRDTDVFVDVGANVGLYTCLASQLGKRVIAVEPLPSNLTYLYRNLQKHKFAQVEVFPMALSAQAMLLTLHGIGAQASFLENWGDSSYAFSKHVSTICPTTTLDTVIGARFPGQRLFIKMDVEGFEREVLEGAASTLDRSPSPIWMIECFLDRHHPKQNLSFAPTFDLFFRRGYEARVARPRGMCVTQNEAERWTRPGSVDGGMYNFIFRAR